MRSQWRYALQYQRVVKNYVGKEGKPTEYKRTARIDDTKPVKHLVSFIKDGSKKYKKHQSYVDNCWNISPLMKDAYSGKNTLSLIFHKTLSCGQSLRIYSINEIPFR